MKKAITLAAMSCAAVASYAATQGAESETQSVATYTNQIGTVATPKIRIFGVQDTTWPSGSSGTGGTWKTQAVIAGMDDGFCVGHSAGGAVQVVFSTPNLVGSTEFPSLSKAKTTAGAEVEYHTTFKVGADGLYGDDTTFQVPAGKTVTDLSNCATPNVRKSIVMGGAVWSPATGVYLDTVTLTATPL